MNRKNLLKWIEELETTDKKQGRYYLHRIEQDGSESFCCLGILTEVAKADGVPMELKVHEYGASIPTFPKAYIIYNERGELPNEAVLNWLGLDRFSTISAKRKPDHTIPARVDMLNDEEGLTFKEIAACLRQTYLTE
jgi:hypothetical protein